MAAILPYVAYSLIAGDVLTRVVSRICSSRDTASDVMQREHEAEMDRENEFWTAYQTNAANFMKLQQQHNTSHTELANLRQQFQEEQERMAKQRLDEKTQYEKRIKELLGSMKDAEQKVAALSAELQKPIKERQKKLAFVNNLNIEIRPTKSLLLLGPKGSGKSTFLWLLNKGEKPTQSYADGTIKLHYVGGFIDSIGLRGWTREELCKLIVLMIYEGIPSDIIIFGSDRIDEPVTSLSLLGITNPMMVIMSSDFWRYHEPPTGQRKRIHLNETGSGVRTVDPPEDIDMVYNLAVYDDLKRNNLGTPLTHHDDIETIMAKREQAGIRPFKYVVDRLGPKFTAKMENNDDMMEMLFRLIYVYETKYYRNKLRFMNHASLRDFD